MGLANTIKSRLFGGSPEPADVRYNCRACNATFEAPPGGAECPECGESQRIYRA